MDVRVRTELPQEIIDTIIDSLSTYKDHPTLKSCTLASRSLRPSSQKHLFSRILLSKNSACDRIYPLLTENPTLCSYVHDIILTSESDQATSPQWLRLNENLACVLDMLTSLRVCSLSIYNDGDWKDIHPHTTTALFRVFALPSLDSIDIGGLTGIPVSFFDIPNDIEELELRFVAFTRTTRTTSDAAASPLFRSAGSLSMTALEFIPNTRAFVNEDPNTIFALTTHPESCFSRITDLRIHVSRDSFPILLPIFTASATSLTSLELNHAYAPTQYHDGRGLNAFQFNLSNFTHLRRLSFQLSIYYYTFTTLPPILLTSAHHLTTLLASSASALERIDSLTVVFYPHDLRSSYEISMPQCVSDLHDIWGRLDDAICQRPSVRRVPHVTFVLKMDIPKFTQLVETRTRWRESMRGKLPVLEERGGVLTFDVDSSVLCYPEDE
ncbi:hypothetical protein Hypma_001511 [Hypsizygus marmoreus]|uniref:F-box domain-containing protein n=1 Tax=Hypsizygus marmoreus TaxID=39966 RepID=A0A369K3P7_HYPMA|nr:hypothetical protein Hypma_001511 [Hypsizygus marmoreus]